MIGLGQVRFNYLRSFVKTAFVVPRVWRTWHFDESQLTYFKSADALCVTDAATADDVTVVRRLGREPLPDVGPHREGEAPLEPLSQAEADEGAEEDDPAPAPLGVVPLEQVGHLPPAKDSVFDVQVLKTIIGWYQGAAAAVEAQR